MRSYSYSVASLTELLEAEFQDRKALRLLAEKGISGSPSLPLVTVFNDREKLPNCPGVYAFCFGDFPLYIGESKVIKLRLSKDHYRIRQALQVWQQCELRWIECDRHMTRLIEQRLILKYAPPLNEAPAVIKEPVESFVTSDNFVRMPCTDLFLITGLPTRVWSDFEYKLPSRAVIACMCNYLDRLIMTEKEFTEGLKDRKVISEKNYVRWLRIQKARCPSFYKAYLVGAAQRRGIKNVVI
jgi:hypothetical protein